HPALPATSTHEGPGVGSARPGGQAMKRWMWVVPMIVAVAGACGGGGGKQPLTAARVPHSVPTITAPATTTTVPPTTTPPTSTPAAPPPPTTTATAVVVDCQVLKDDYFAKYRSVYGSAPRNQDLVAYFTFTGRPDCIDPSWRLPDLGQIGNSPVPRDCNLC